MTYEKLEIVSASHPGFTGYELAKRPSIIGNSTFDSLVSVSSIIKGVYYRDIDWRLPLDIRYTGGVETKPDLNPDNLFILKGKTMRRPGIWANNGFPATSEQMLMWKPGAITVFYDYIDEGLVKYKQDNPGCVIIVRFNHPQNWRNDITNSAYARGREVASKWDTLKKLDPYVYVGNEINLHYENGDNDAGNQGKYETREFYNQWGIWVATCARVIKDVVPEMKLVCPPFASGHHEDGAPNDDGNITEQFAGYDSLQEIITRFFDNIICHHDYWGNSGGCVDSWLYGSEASTWYAYRWKRVAKLFKTRYNKDIRLIIDECGNMQANHPNFTQQVIDYSTKCLQDSRIIAMTYFLWNDPTNSPGNVMNSWVQRIPNLQAHLQRLRDMSDVVISTPTIPPVTPPIIPPVVIPPTVEPPVTPPAQASPVEIIGADLSVVVSYPPGLNLIIANWLNDDAVVYVTGPMGGKRQTFTKNKLEFAQRPGQGGFELYCEPKGIYTLEIDGYIIKVNFDGRCMKLIFSQTTTPPVTPPPIEEPKIWCVVPKTGLMAKAQAELLFATLQANELTKNLFELKEVK